MQSIYSKIEELIAANTPAAICIVTGTAGSTPRKTGAKMIVYADGSIYGTIGGGAIEKRVIEKAVEQLVKGYPEKYLFDLEEELAMHCGGTMEVFIEPLALRPPLYIFGGGHIGSVLARFACELDFSAHVIDPRPEVFENNAFEGCTCIRKDYFEAIEEIGFTPAAFIVIVTPRHLYDEDILARVAHKPHTYIGMIGSQRKVALLKERFLKEGLMTREELDAIDMPVGLKMKAETPQEIAISILARLIDVRNGGKVGENKDKR